MPGVKKLHQSSENNSKAQYIMGHSLQAISQLAKSPTGHVAAVPLTARIHEGLKYNPDSTRCLLDKLVEMFVAIIPDNQKALLAAYAYYASWKVIFPLLEQDHHLLTRIRKNAVAYLTPEAGSKGKRGHHKIYGRKIKLNEHFKQKKKFTQIPSPLYGEKRNPSDFVDGFIMASHCSMRPVCLGNSPHAGKDYPDVYEHKLDGGTDHRIIWIPI